MCTNTTGERNMNEKEIEELDKRLKDLEMGNDILSGQIEEIHEKIDYIISMMENKK